MSFPLPQTARLLLRPMEESDFENCSRLVLEDSIFYWLGNETLSRQAAKKAWQEMNQPDIFNAILVLKETGAFCGRICMQKTNTPLPELGVALLQEYRGLGLGPEAICAFANWYGRQQGLDRLRVCIHPENLHSLHIFKKLGAVAEPASPPPAKNADDPLPRPNREPRGFVLPLPVVL